jgi:prepilin-type N-terminal cleavage/methylation domain-containing protein
LYKGYFPLHVLHVFDTISAMQKADMQHRGFTLIELLLVIGLIAVLSSMVIAALSPTRQLGSSRDAKRRSDVNTILNAVYQYAIDHQGILPSSIPNGSAREICILAAGDCDEVDLDALSGTYLVSIPVDPQASTTGTGTDYFIRRDDNGRLTITAPNAEGDAVISSTR